MKAANEVLRFVVELLALAALAYSAAQAVDGPARFALALVVLAAAVAFWGVLVAPKSTRRLRDPVRLGAEVVFFAAAGAALVAAGSVSLGVALAVVAIGNALLLRLHEPVLGALE